MSLRHIEVYYLNGECENATYNEQRAARLLIGSYHIGGEGSIHEGKSPEELQEVQQRFVDQATELLQENPGRERFINLLKLPDFVGLEGLDNV